jgi:hypothetical protein
MSENDSADRRALGILSDTVAAELGASNKVSKEIRRAYTSGRQIDRFMARAAFDALPGDERSKISRKAIVQAQQTAEPDFMATARDWRDMEPPGRKARATPRRSPSAPPRFLSRKEE